MKSESIKTVGRIGYIRLFNDRGNYESPRDVSLEDGEWRRIIWRFYWKES